MKKLSSILAGPVTRAAASGAGLLLVSGLAQAQEVANRVGLDDPASDYGYRFSELFWLITTLCCIAFSLVIVLIAIPVMRDRDRPGHKAKYDHGASLKDKRLTAVISITTFVVLDAWVLVIAMRDLREAYWNYPTAAQDDVYRVEVLAQQWAWNFRGAGVDGEFGTPDDILETNHLTVPKERAVHFQMTSKDVIHSLFLPEMRMKKDANPGAINEAWFRAITAGDFTILCAELCGYAHYQMHGGLTVLEQDQFDTWEQEASQLGAAAFDAEDEEAQWAWEWQE